MPAVPLNLSITQAILVFAAEFVHQVAPMLSGTVGGGAVRRGFGNGSFSIEMVHVSDDRIDIIIATTGLLELGFNEFVSYRFDTAPAFRPFDLFTRIRHSRRSFVSEATGHF